MNASDFHICNACSELIPVVAAHVTVGETHYCNEACRDRAKPAGVCVVCRLDWKACECGPMGDVLDLEHALSQGAAMEAKGEVR